VPRCSAVWADARGDGRRVQSDDDEESAQEVPVVTRLRWRTTVYGLEFRVYGLLRVSARSFRWSRGLSGHMGRASLRSHDFKLLCLNSI